MTAPHWNEIYYSDGDYENKFSIESYTNLCACVHVNDCDGCAHMYWCYSWNLYIHIYIQSNCLYLSLVLFTTCVCCLYAEKLYPNILVILKNKKKHYRIELVKGL